MRNKYRKFLWKLIKEIDKLNIYFEINKLTYYPSNQLKQIITNELKKNPIKYKKELQYYN